MTTEPDKAADEDPTVVAAPAPPAPPPAAEPVRPAASRRPSGRVVLALAGAFLAGAVCTACVGAAVVAVAHHGDDRGDFRRHDRGDHFRRDGDERGPRRVYPVPQGGPGRPVPPGVEVWPVPGGDGLPVLPDPNGPTQLPVPAKS
ncbi:hypothetical protein [Catellatospora tritici]|uniref:hypothetical protein n=1 Tax=Catellatospora tritici TaxID=2851566 RepID=UPI001C2D87ED|nr:hypothetical protein [Catellatospora tritici]MBV1853576.1 hypothetical protein [Catellatospora tritici]